MRKVSPRTAAQVVTGVAVIVVIFYFLGRGLAANWDELRSEEIDVQPALLVLGAAFVLGDFLLRIIIWRELLSQLSGGARFPLGRSAIVFLYSWVGRYVPGKVAYPVGRFYLGRSLGASTPALVGSIGYETVLVAVAAFGFASVTVVPSLAVVSDSVLPYLALPAVAIGGVVALHPRVLRWGLALVLRLLGREFITDAWLLPPRQMARLIALYFVAFSLSGVGFYLLIISLTPYGVGYLPLAAGAFTLAGVMGMVMLIAPAGIGVREGFLVGVLQFTMPVELAILISLVARAWATALDVLVVGGAFAFDYVSGERMLFAAFSGRRRMEAVGDPSAALDP